MSGMAPSAAQAAPPRQPEPQQSSARPYEAAGQYMPAPPAYAGEPRVINTKPVQLPPLDVADKIGQEQAQNRELIMSVPLEAVSYTHLNRGQDHFWMSWGTCD